MLRTLRCRWWNCNASFPRQGNRRYCPEQCSRQARLVQNRKAKRRQRRREHEDQIAERIRRLEDVGELSAVRPRRFRLPLRRVS